MRQETKACVVAALEQCDDYPARAAAICAIFDSIVGVEIDPVRQLLCRMAFAGLVEFYGGWDRELASWALQRELILAEDLSDIEAALSATQSEGTPTTLKTYRSGPQPPVEFAAARAECSQILANTAVLRAQQPQQAQLPPGTRPSYTMMRAVAIMRQREREEG